MTTPTTTKTTGSYNKPLAKLNDGNVWASVPLLKTNICDVVQKRLFSSVPINKFVQTTVRLFNAIFFSIFFFILWILYVSIDLFHKIPIDFTGFCDRFGNFYNVVTDIWIDGWTDRWIEQWTDRQNNGRTGQWMDGHAIYNHRGAINNDFAIDFAIFTMWLHTYGLMVGS